MCCRSREVKEPESSLIDSSGFLSPGSRAGGRKARPSSLFVFYGLRELRRECIGTCCVLRVVIDEGEQYRVVRGFRADVRSHDVLDSMKNLEGGVR